MLTLEAVLRWRQRQCDAWIETCADILPRSTTRAVRFHHRRDGPRRCLCSKSVLPAGGSPHARPVYSAGSRQHCTCTSGKGPRSDYSVGAWEARSPRRSLPLREVLCPPPCPCSQDHHAKQWRIGPSVSDSRRAQPPPNRSPGHPLARAIGPSAHLYRI